MKINRIYVRRYSDTGQTVAYCDHGEPGRSRTEAGAKRLFGWRKQEAFATYDFGEHMHALFRRAKREGLRMQRETW